MHDTYRCNNWYIGASGSYLIESANGEIGLSINDPNPILKSLLSCFILATV